MTTLTQCSGCGRWIADMANHQPQCPMDRPRPVEQLAPIDSFEQPSFNLSERPVVRSFSTGSPPEMR
jgi:hypothetical protein